MVLADSFARRVYKVPKRRVGLLGASCLTGERIISNMDKSVWEIIAFSRKQSVIAAASSVEWLRYGDSQIRTDQCQGKEKRIPFWICAAPIWVLPEYFSLLEAYGASRVVVLSSTSRFTKEYSMELRDRVLAKRLSDAELEVEAWAVKRGVECIILRPTLIYGYGRDSNISEIANFINRFGFFLLLGKSNGLRQPIHVDDVATVCITALDCPCKSPSCYDIAGGERLSYREMVCRVFVAMGRKPKFLNVPLSIFKIIITFLRLFPRYRYLSNTMALRMNSDQTFDFSRAEDDLGFSPRGFAPTNNDLPV